MIGDDTRKVTHVLALDLGASNGRAIVATYSLGRIEFEEVHRFSNEAIEFGNYLYWDFPKLFHELKIGLIKAKSKGYKLQSIGIDSWGVDYGLIDQDGELASNPISYRDKRGADGMDKLLKQIDKDDLKKLTGLDCVSYNTVNQLMSERLIKKTEYNQETNYTMLNIPDLFNYFLTGVKTSEFSMATTSQLFDYNVLDWNFALIEKLEIPKHLFSPIIPSGTIIGEVKKSLLSELKIDPLQVVSVTSHDTASAIRSISSKEEDFLFIATGTWVIVGANQKKMTMNKQVMEYNLRNEGGKFPYVNLMKNFVGLWMLQESKRFWIKEGYDIDFEDMVKQAENVEIHSFIDIRDSRFFEPGDMPSKVMEFSSETKQQVPKTIGEIVRVIEQSLAKEIAVALGQIEEAIGKTYSKVHVIGGGIQDRLFCSLVEKYSGKEVIIGAKEATTFGNVIDQFIALGTFTEENRIEILNNSIN